MVKWITGKVLGVNSLTWYTFEIFNSKKCNCTAFKDCSWEKFELQSLKGKKCVYKFTFET